MSAVYAVLAALLVAAATASDPDTAPECSVKCQKSFDQCVRNPDSDACFHELNSCLCQCGKLLQAVLASPRVSPSFQQRLVFSRLPASLSGLSDRARTDYNCTRTSVNGIADCLERCSNSTDLKCRLECYVSGYDTLCVCKSAAQGSQTGHTTPVTPGSPVDPTTPTPGSPVDLTTPTPGSPVDVTTPTTAGSRGALTAPTPGSPAAQTKPAGASSVATRGLQGLLLTVAATSLLALLARA